MISRFLLKPAGMAALAVLMILAPAGVLAQSDTVLKPADTKKLLPETVYYKAQSASVQQRNSGGVKFADGYYMLAMLVDTSGYSSDIQAKYQAYFITEVPLKLEGKSLPAGIYGVGFVADNKMIVTDVGAHDLFTVSYKNDDVIKHPMPLQVVADAAGGFRLYEGRKYIHFSR